MAYQLEAGALWRIVHADPGDPLVARIERDHIRPFIDPVTLGLVHNLIRRVPDCDPAQRTALEHRHQALVDRLRRGGSGLELVELSLVDLKASEILQDLLGIDDGAGAVSELDLIAVACAIQHNRTLLVGSRGPAFVGLAQAIPEEVGRLQVEAHADADAE